MYADWGWENYYRYMELGWKSIHIPGTKAENPCSLYDVIEPPPTPFPLPLIVSANSNSVLSTENLIWFSNIQGGQMFRAATTKSRCMDTLKWICWRFLRQCWNVKVPSYALIRAYVTCMVNVFFHINHVSHTLLIN